ncbi:hypothetical protein B566_EDAN014681 [Ephemera danica]|nr:hypothetical protein B566_EDAN014681 [Ephemera danica]
MIPIMALASDSVLMILKEMNRDLSFYDDIITFLGLCYAGKVALSVTCSLIKGIHAHFFTKICSTTDLTTSYGKWAVVTGSTDGIGKAYAQELARRGVNIILISRNLERLSKVAEELEYEFGVETKIIQADFSDGKQIYEQISRELGDIEVGILVNNVGVILPYPMDIEDMSEDQVWSHINVNIGAATMMCKMLVKPMKERRRGAIVNISSISGMGPTPYLSVYGATKAYMDSFSQALNYECRSSGVTVQTLTPGYVNTQMVSYSPSLKRGGLLVPSAAVFAKNAILTMGVSNKTTGYWSHGLEYWFFSVLPSWVWMNTCGLLNKQFRQEYDLNQTKEKIKIK